MAMTTTEMLQELHNSTFYEPAGNMTELYPALGLAEEAGEVLGKFKKAIRDGDWIPGDGMPSEYREKILDEMGDVLYYYNAILVALYADYDTVMAKHREKRDRRITNGTLHGDGDDR